MIIAHDIDIKTTPYIPLDIAFSVTQHHAGVHELRFRILDKNKEVDLSKYSSAKIVLSMPDNMTVKALGVIKGNRVTYILQRAELAQTGNVAVTLSLGGLGQPSLTTRLNVMVERAPGDIPFPSPAQADAIDALIALVSRTLSTQTDQVAVINRWIADPGQFIGPPGADGRDGAGISIVDAYDTLADLQKYRPTGKAGDGCMVGANLYVWSAQSAAWKNVGTIRGEKGAQGAVGPMGPSGKDADVTAMNARFDSIEAMIGAAAASLQSLAGGDF